MKTMLVLSALAATCVGAVALGTLLPRPGTPCRTMTAVALGNAPSGAPTMDMMGEQIGTAIAGEPPLSMPERERNQDIVVTTFDYCLKHPSASLPDAAVAAVRQIRARTEHPFGTLTGQ